MSIEGKKSLLQMASRTLHRDTDEEIEQQINTLGVIIRQASGLKRLVSHSDWKYMTEVIAEVRGMIIREGQLSSDKDERYSAFDTLSAIDNIDVVIRNIINNGEKALQQHNDLQTKLNKRRSRSA